MMRSATMKTASPLRLRIQQATAVGMLAVGTGFALLGFWAPPVGSIDESVLWIFAQCLIYTGSVLGVGSYLQTLAQSLRSDMAATASGAPDVSAGHCDEEVCGDTP